MENTEEKPAKKKTRKPDTFNENVYIPKNFQQYAVVADNIAKLFPTRSFGEIHFSGSLGGITSKFVRLTDYTGYANLETLLLDVWKISKPTLVFALIGDQSDLDLKENQKKALKEGLANTLTGTDKWLITCGCNKGITEISQDLLSETLERPNYIAIGVVSWANVALSERLENSNTKGMYPAEYPSTSDGGNLNKFSTHYLFVDNGAQAALESEHTIWSTLMLGIADTYRTIDVISLCVKGDQYSIRQILQTLKRGMPCIILNKTGGAADIIAFAYTSFGNFESDDAYKTVVLTFLNSTFAKMTEEEYDEILNDVLACMKYRHFIVLHDLLDDEETGLNESISTGITKTKTFVINSLSTIIQLDDIDAAIELLEPYQGINFDMTQCLILSAKYCKIEFVQLLLDHGAKLADITNNDIEKEFWWYEFPNGKLKNVKEIINWYFKDKITTPFEMKTCDRPMFINFILFFYSLMLHDKTASEFYFQQNVEFINSSLFATRILRKESKRTRDVAVTQELVDLANDYEERAVSLINNCYEGKPQKTLSLLYTCDGFFRANSVTLATFAKCRKVIATEAFQEIFNEMWHGDIDHKIPKLQVLITFILPLLIPFISISYNRHKFNIAFKILAFYKSPAIKFIQYVIYHVALLISFGLFLTYWYDFNNLTIMEVILAICITAILFDEIKQFVSVKGSVYYKVRRFFSSFWNIFDVLGVITFMNGFLLRIYLIETHNYCNHQWCQVFFTVSWMCLSQRLLHCYYLHPKLGPKVVMILKMIKDIGCFMLILLHFMIFMGTPNYIIKYVKSESKQRSIDWADLFNEAIYFPYMRVYGNLFANDGGFSKIFRDNFHSILLIIYMLLTSALLLNMLIAFFGNTFSTIQEMTEYYWRFEKFVFLEELDANVPLLGPLSVVHHIYTFVISTLSRMKGRKLDVNMFSAPIPLGKFENVMFSKYHGAGKDLLRFTSEFDLNDSLNIIEHIETLTSNQIDVMDSVETKLTNLKKSLKIYVERLEQKNASA